MKEGGTPGRGSPVFPGVPSSGSGAAPGSGGGGGDTEPRMIAAAELLAAMNTDPGEDTPASPEPEEAASAEEEPEQGSEEHEDDDLPEGVSPLGRTDPSHVGAFELLGRIGAGGMGAVFLGRDSEGRLGAVKLIRPEYAADPSFLARFHDEVALADRVSPFCTAQVLDHGIAEHNRPYLVTEYVEGLSLERQVLEHGPLPAANLHGVAVGVAAALTAIHTAGLVHRDLKPANVILSWSGPRVIDFGIARAMDAPHGRTQKGIVLGSPGWMSPEQLAGAPVTPSSDIFNWGCLVSFAANGRHPFGEGDPVTMAGRMMHGQPDLGDLEEPLRGLAAAAMSKDPSRRPTARYLMLGSLGRPETKKRKPAEAADSIPDTRSAVNAVLHRWQPPAPPPYRRPPGRPIPPRPMPGPPPAGARPPAPRPGGPPFGPPPSGPIPAGRPPAGHGQAGPGQAGHGPRDPGQVGAGQAGPGHTGHGQAGPGPAGPGPGHTGHGQGGPGPAGGGQGGPGAAGPGQAGYEQAGSPQAGQAQGGPPPQTGQIPQGQPAPAGPGPAGPGPTGLGHAGQGQVGSGQAGLGPAAGPGQTGIGPPGQAAAGQPGPGPVQTGQPGPGQTGIGPPGQAAAGQPGPGPVQTGQPGPGQTGIGPPGQAASGQAGLGQAGQPGPGQAALGQPGQAVSGQVGPGQGAAGQGGPPSGPIPVIPPPPGRKRLRSGFPWWIVLAAVLVLLLVLLGGLVMMSGERGEHPQSRARNGVADAQPSRSTESPAATMHGRTQNPEEFGPQTVHIGQAGTDADMRFQVNSLSCGKKHVGSDDDPLTASGTFCVADVSVTNVGDDPRTLSFKDQKLYDTTDKAYPSSPYNAKTFPDQFLFKELKPNETASGPIVFDVPESAAADHLVLHGDDSGKGLTVQM